MKNSTLNVLIVILFILIPAQLIPEILGNSLYGDEAAHIISGFSKLKTLDYRLNPEQGPVSDMIEAIPLLFTNTYMPTEDPAWKIKDENHLIVRFFFDYNKDPYKIMVVSRLSMIFLSLLLAFYVYKWATELYGKKAGIFALFLYVFSTDMLAYAGFVGNDFGLAVFCFIALYYLWRYIRQPTLKMLIIAGIIFSLAQLTKFSAVFLLPIYLLIFGYLVFADYNPGQGISFPDFGIKSDKIKKIIFFGWSLLIILAITYVIILFVYHFEGVGVPLDVSMANDVSLNKTIYPVESFSTNKILDIAMKLPSPVPYYYARGLGAIFLTSGLKVGSLIVNGEPTATPYFFLYAFLLKTQIPLLIFFFYALHLTLFKKKAKYDDLFLLIPFAIFHLAFMFTKFQFGYRYVLQTVPFLFVFSSKLIRLADKTPLKKIILIILCIWYALAAIMISPHQFSYFNELITPQNAYKQFIDSNIDWGQDLLYLVNYVHKNNIINLSLSFYGFPVEYNQRLPPYYNLTYSDLSCQRTPGIKAISVSNLMRNTTCYGWLMNETPVKRIGYSILVYNITQP